LRLRDPPKPAGVYHSAAVGWSSAGGLSIVLLQYREALDYFLACAQNR